MPFLSLSNVVVFYYYLRLAILHSFPTHFVRVINTDHNKAEKYFPPTSSHKTLANNKRVEQSHETPPVWKMCPTASHEDEPLSSGSDYHHVPYCL